VLPGAAKCQVPRLQGSTIPWGWWGFLGKYRWFSGGNWGFPNRFSFGWGANSGSPGGSAWSVWASPPVLLSSTVAVGDLSQKYHREGHFVTAQSTICHRLAYILLEEGVHLGGAQAPIPLFGFCPWAGQSNVVMWVQGVGARDAQVQAATTDWAHVQGH
jgi:hypothetical protein